MRKIAVLFTLMFGLTLLSFTQPPTGIAHADAYAVIITPTVLLTAQNVLHFGTVMPGLQGGTVILTTDGGRTSTGGVYLIDSGDNYTTPLNAIFRVVGKQGTLFNITLPETTTITGDGTDVGTMIVNTYTTSIGNPGTIAASGTEFSVGATLNVDNIANQPNGTYHGTFDVVVNNE